MTPSSRRRPYLVILLIAVTFLGTPSVFSSAGAAAVAAVPSSWPAAPSRPFSDPLWLPVREPATVWCVHSNGCPNAGHGFWAIDLIGKLGDPVHAAGAGIFHVGAVDSSCQRTTVGGGTWAWIDHGGGVVTRYGHLDSLLAVEGQLVTPATTIGTMGHSGDIAPCTTNYLHFEVRTGGVNGARINPGQLLGCSGAVQQSYPSEWGYTSWNSIYRGSRTTPVLGKDCLPATLETSTPPASIGGLRGNRSAQVSWTPPSYGAGTVDRYVVTQEVWSPSINAWKTPSYRTVAATGRVVTFTGLTNGARYRHRVVAHNRFGHSAWSRYVEVVPATVPLAPGSRALTSGSSWVRLGWTNATAQGTPVTSFTVALRRLTAGGWTAWRYTTVPNTERTYRWDGQLAARSYQVVVRANSAVGPSPWGTFQRIATTR